MNLSGLRSHNTARVLGLLRAAGAAGVSRLELAERTGLTPQAVSKITARLRDEGLAAGAGRGVPTGGKPRTLLRLVPDAAHAVGLHLDRDELTAVLLDLAGATVAARTRPLDLGEGPGAVLAAAVEEVAALRGDGTLTGVGIAMPGPLDHTAGVPHRVTGFPAWDGFPLRDTARRALAERLGQDVPVALDKDTNAAALALALRADDDREAGAGDREAADDDREAADGVPGGRGGAPGGGGGSQDGRGGTPEGRGGAPDRLGAAPDDRGGPADGRGGSPDRPGGAPGRPGGTSGRVGVAPDGPGVTPGRVGVAPDGPGVTPDRPGAAPGGRPSAPPADGAASFAYLHVGTGLGAGLVLAGVLHRGARTGAGEFGHQTVQLDGAACGCGGRGCLEALCLAAVARGDLDEAARVLGAGAANLAGLLDVDRVLLGGRVVAAAPGPFLRGVGAALADRARRAGEPPVPVALATGSPHLVAEGAAQLVLAPLFGR
ncbi:MULTISPECIES: ROK family transcriptional regulator [Streptomyces]|uniref:ROK family protein n=1 Tax=Streptomyces changanensis TaxID=2964669 RepID=A0ABY5N3Y4_9ACTN|nr:MULTISPECIES: ROK family protein [Streptomyces]UUS31247.1 ROK family protein [Streptomyces changanensis]